MANKIKAIKKDKALFVKLMPNEDLDINREYANYVEVSQTPYDFSLKFCDANPFHGNKEQIKNNNVEHPIPIVAEIAIPFQIVPDLINALKSQWNAYKKNIKKIEE
jgi:hypothetical protein